MITIQKFKYLIFEEENDNDYQTLMSEEVRIEKLLKRINNEIYIDSFVTRDIGETIEGTIFILSVNSLESFNDIRDMTETNLGRGRYQCIKSMENIKLNKNSRTSIGNYDTVIIRRKTFLKLPHNIYLRIFIKIILLIIFIYILHLFITIYQ